MSVLRWLAAVLVLVAAPCVWSSQPLKVLRIAFAESEDGFDPARIIDLYSHSVAIHICESLYAYDYLAIPQRSGP
jgi:hypothetical protein